MGIGHIHGPATPTSWVHLVPTHLGAAYRGQEKWVRASVLHGEASAKRRLAPTTVEFFFEGATNWPVSAAAG